ncbi:MAG: DNA repair protein RadC [Planctomycetota bacterium]|jgi:DNA repair protein RadC
MVLWTLVSRGIIDTFRAGSRAGLEILVIESSLFLLVTLQFAKKHGHSPEFDVQCGVEPKTDNKRHRMAMSRLETLGPSALADHELLGLITGTMNDDRWRTILLSEPLGLAMLFRLTSKELADLSGLGASRAARIEASFELGRRVALAKSELRPRFINSQQIFQYVEPELRGIQQEAFEVLVLDARNRLLRRERISLGTLTGSLVHPREVFRVALRVSACAIVLVHNHPSGDPSPSTEDIQVTDRLRRAGDLLGIRVLDHVIVGDGRYVSMADRGHLATAS